MKFLSKYQLRERITGRPVEVYLAQEVRSGLSRLVHVLEWKEDSEEVTSQKILEQICRFAPQPPGIILEAGKDETTPQAYLVTTLPVDPLAIQAWVQSYEQTDKSASSGKPAADLPNIEITKAKPSVSTQSVAQNDVPTAALNVPVFPPPTSASTKVCTMPGEFTKAFSGMAARQPPAPQRVTPEPAAPEPKVSSGQFPVVEAPKPDLPLSADEQFLREVGSGAQSDTSKNWGSQGSGSFTKEFLGVLGDGPVERDSVLPKSSPPKSPPPKAAFPKSAPPKSAEPKSDTRPPGTFTREFFGLAGKGPAAPSPTGSEGSFPPELAQGSPKPEHRDLLSDIDIPPAKPEYSPLARDEYRETSLETKFGSKPESKAKTGEFTEFFRAGEHRASDQVAQPSVREDRATPFDHGNFGTPETEAEASTNKGAFPESFFASPSKPAPDAFAGELRTSDPPIPDFGGRNFAAPKQPPANLDRDGRPAAPRFDSTGEFGGVGKSRNYTPSGPAPFEVDHAPNFQPGASIGVPEPAWDGPARPADASKDATHLFTPPGAGPMPSSLPQEEGPSEFTMVLQRGNQAPPPPQAPAGKGPASGPSNFKLPAMQVPQIPSSPVMPQAPQMPHMQTPQIPQAPSLPMAAPKLPAGKSPAPAAKSPISYLPLIITVNVVLVLAVALVLYFVLKSH